MIQTTYKEHLAQSASEVLESMCFIELGEETIAPSIDDADSIACRLEFIGPYEGSFGLRATLPAATVIVCNLLGEEADQLTQKHITESMGEIANMVCGAVLGHVETRHAFTLTSPREDHESFEKSQLDSRTTASFALEEGVLTTWLEIKPTV